MQNFGRKPMPCFNDYWKCRKLYPMDRGVIKIAEKYSRKKNDETTRIKGWVKAEDSWTSKTYKNCWREAALQEKRSHINCKSPSRRNKFLLHDERCYRFLIKWQQRS
ncbi:unnamed protein product [Blepharisma stoltei]|uniref:Uncharacterized protein n=1 Tax=Blepharisma stoltei TaxID=1481888 RepID=A0AAU9JEN6_9CILI|nr:unnamed protein product [Blepharisma stoltei]